MLEISNHICNILATDDDIISYLGATASEDRIYSEPFPNQITYSSTKKAALLYYDTMDKQPIEFSYPSQIPNSHIYFQIVSIDKTTLKNIELRIIELLDKISFSTTNFKVGIILINGSSGGNTENTEGTSTFPIYVRNLSFVLKEIFKKPL